MKKYVLVSFLLLGGLRIFAQPYFPLKANWQTKTPAELGINQEKVNDIIKFAQENESKVDRNQETAQSKSFGKEPFGFGIGPFSERGEATGLMIYKGYIIAQWGEPANVEMSHSVTKSFLSTVVGLGVKKGLIKNTDDLVYPYMSPVEVYGEPLQRDNEQMGKPELLDLFNTPHNKTITWDHLLRQTSDWEGTLWGKPEWADRPSKDTLNWQTRPRNASGSVYEYNDTRVNILALAALNLWRKPLPEVLKTEVMDKIAASDSWRWMGYRNSFVVIDGQIIQSVSGGGHWGGGMFINAYDMARFGLLTTRNGKWENEQIIAPEWLEKSRTPTTAQLTYGYMNFFLNTDKAFLSDAPEHIFIHIGNGTNLIYCDDKKDLVIVSRWLDNKAMNGLAKTISAAF